MADQTLVFLFAMFILLAVSNCSSQNGPADRHPVVAGQFYPPDKDGLQKTLKDLFSRALPSKKLKDVVAVISPHAGYVFSGEVAASSFNQIDPGRAYETIFLLGPSHQVAFDGAAVYTGRRWITPLGPVGVNREAAKQLLKKSPAFTERQDAHLYEHSLEVQLPFLQHCLKRTFSIVPIVFGTEDPVTLRRIAEVLKPYLNPKNLVVVSTDFSHYPRYDDASMVDRATGEAVLSNSAENLLRTIHTYEKKGIAGLSTCMCGLSCVFTLLSMTEGNPQVAYHAIQYKNSGDAGIAGKDRVVGYHAIAVSMGGSAAEGAFQLRDSDKRELLAVARRTIEEYVRTGRVSEIGPAGFSATLRMNCGAFVTLHKRNMLRGCIGRFDAHEPLYKVVQDMAVASATQDYRFPPVTKDEVDKLELEISVLSPMRRVSSIDEITLGKHGIYIKKGMQGGTFLPQVATETGWSKEEFLGHCAQDKAGLGWDGWKDAEVYIYEALVFSEKDVARKGGT